MNPEEARQKIFETKTPPPLKRSSSEVLGKRVRVAISKFDKRNADIGIYIYIYIYIYYYYILFSIQMVFFNS
jgi:hypothetical protein